ncbi:hypothetical protein PM082_015718 [Marasmius tenuissimus]|nr:hypothetical protein PM082_015718 [Marasmius tenuissimus]
MKLANQVSCHRLSKGSIHGSSRVRPANVLAMTKIGGFGKCRGTVQLVPTPATATSACWTSTSVKLFLSTSLLNQIKFDAEFTIQITIESKS